MRQYRHFSNGPGASLIARTAQSDGSPNCFPSVPLEPRDQFLGCRPLSDKAYTAFLGNAPDIRYATCQF